MAWHERNAIVIAFLGPRLGNDVVQSGGMLCHHTARRGYRLFLNTSTILLQRLHRSPNHDQLFQRSAPYTLQTTDQLHSSCTMVDYRAVPSTLGHATYAPRTDFKLSAQSPGSHQSFCFQMGASSISYGVHQRKLPSSRFEIAPGGENPKPTVF